MTVLIPPLSLVCVKSQSHPISISLSTNTDGAQTWILDLIRNHCVILQEAPYGTFLWVCKAPNRGIYSVADTLYLEWQI